MEIDFDALDQAIAEKRAAARVTTPAIAKSPKYIDVIQSGAVKKPLAVRQSSKRTKRVVKREVEKATEPPVNLAELIDRELEAGDAALGEDLPEELNVDDLVAYAEAVGAPGVAETNPREAAAEFLHGKQELAPFLPNVKVDKAPLSDDLPQHVLERAEKSEREQAKDELQDELVAEKPSKKAEKAAKAAEKAEEKAEQKAAKAEQSKPSRRKTWLLVLLGVLIVVFGALAGAFVYLILND